MKRNIVLYVTFAFAIYSLPVLLGESYYIHVLVITGIYVIAALGVDLVNGFAGQVSLCQAAFFGLGAYTSAILSSTYKIPVLLALAIAILFTSVIAFLVGAPILRLRRHYLGICALGLSFIVEAILVTLQNITGGANGFKDIVPLSFGGIKLNKPGEYYYLVWTISMAMLFITHNIVCSRVGRAFLALQGDEVAASSCGINTHMYKIQAFVLSAAYASVAGGLYAHYNRFISPQIASVPNSVEMIFMVVLGGIQTVYGVIIGAAIVKSIPEVLESFPDYQAIATGVILIVLLLYMPRGLLGLVRERWPRKAKWERAL
jgi:branched-chain amino acid transport system permease protein